MPRTAEQEQADRLAARARKKRGTGGKKKETTVFNMQVAANEGRKREFRKGLRELADQQWEENRRRQEKEHQIFEAKVAANVKNIVEACIRDLPKKGSFFVHSDTDGFHRIVELLKKQYAGTEFRWHFSDKGFSLAKKR